MPIFKSLLETLILRGLRPRKINVLNQWLRGCLKSLLRLCIRPPAPQFWGGLKFKVPQNWGLKALWAYMKRGRVQQV